MTELSQQDLSKILYENRDRLIIYVGSQYGSAFTPDISHMTKNGDAVQINLETSNFDNIEDSPDWQGLNVGPPCCPKCGEQLLIVNSAAEEADSDQRCGACRN